MSGEHTPEETPAKSNLMPPWQPGQSGNPNGRPKGARAKLAEDFCQALLDDFIEAGPDAIRLMRAVKPNEYARMIASIIPKELDANVKGEMSDEMKRWLGMV